MKCIKAKSDSQQIIILHFIGVKAVFIEKTNPHRVLDDPRKQYGWRVALASAFCSSLGF